MDFIFRLCYKPLIKTTGVTMRALLLFGLILLQACATKQKISSATLPAAPPLLSHPRQVTFEGRRAGEGYFSQDGSQVIFQSEREPGNPFYQIYLMDMKSGKTTRVSPGKGKTSCAWIAPGGKKVLFASTHADPLLKQKEAEEWAERKEPKKKYNWSFDEAYEIYEASPTGKDLKNLTNAKGYDAEGSYSPDGHWIAFASNRAAYQTPLSPEDQAKFDRDPSYMMDIYIMRADGRDVKRLTDVKGYDGGPFFSPDGRRITFRRFSEDGHAAEIYTMNVDGSDQKRLTHLNAMSWAPFYHPSGDYLIFATNKEGYANFELYIVDVKGEKAPVRASDLPNFDGLPVFTPDGRGLLWTHTGENGEAQLWYADWNDSQARAQLGLPLPQIPLGPPPTEKLAVDDVKSWVEYLASDKFGGRPTGGPTELEYSEKLLQTFKAMGLKTRRHHYEFTRGLTLGPNNALKIGAPAEIEKDWVPLSYSKTGTFAQAPVIFAGYGIKAPAIGNQAEYDSYQGLDVKGKWVLAFAGLPEDVTNERRFHLHVYSRLQHKATVAKQAGALGLILVDDAVTPPSELKLNFEGRVDDSGIAAIRLSPALADQVFKQAGMDRKFWTEKLRRGEIAGEAMPKVTVQADIDLVPLKGSSDNLIAVLETPGAKNAVLIGAHLDHLGRGEGGTSLSKVKGVIHYGADDNASGVAGVLHAARALTEQVKHGLRLKQNLVFALWTGEEIGILGSNRYVESELKKDKISAQINLDMIGRLREHLIVQGLGSAKEWKSLVERNNVKLPMPLAITEDPYLPSDALAFYMAKIPTLMLFTGSHAEYHTGEDKPALINYEGLVKTADWAANMAALLASSEIPLVKYVKVETTKKPGEGRGFRLYLGTIPDYTQEGKKGVVISGTSKDSPAEKAGLKAGDIITSLGGMKIENLNDYVYCLQALKANQTIKIRLMRAGLEKEMEITPVLKNQTR